MRKIVTLIGSLYAYCLLASSTAGETSRILDDFSDASRWNIVAAEGVQLDVREERSSATSDQSVLCLDMNFVSGGGYAGIRRELPLELPANFELAFSVRGDLPRNNLECKLVNASGNNVWWVNRRAFEFPRDWTRLASRRRHLQFAWGPSNAPIRRVRAIEIVIASVEGGRGKVCLDDITFRPLPETKPYTGVPSGSASSQASDETAARFACDARLDTAWQSAPSDEKPTLTIDFGVLREFGGLVVRWDPNFYSDRYDVQFSDDGENWSAVRTVDAGSGRRQFISLPDSEARAIRLAMERRGRGKQVRVQEVEVLPLDAARDANAFAAVIAADSPRGYYPRATQGEGTRWTIVGSSSNDREALISEDGAVEVDKQSFSIEPFLFGNGRLQTWSDAEITQSLAGGHAPVPTVVRQHDGLRLSVTAGADGQRNESALLLRYAVTNTSAKHVSGVLYLAVRPFQVNPPYQWLNATGGVAPVGRIGLGESQRVIEVDDRQIALSEISDGFGSAVFDEGDVTSFLSQGQLPPHVSVNDPQQAASAAARYRFKLDPNESRDWVLCVPFSQDAKDKSRIVQQFLGTDDANRFVCERQQDITKRWVDATSTFDLLVPEEAAEIVDTMRSTLAYILINRDGAGIQPGSRSYERSWIRDGSLTAAALLRFGLDREAREFVDWYAPFQFESGKVPCVVDRRGPDPVPENDSHGQFIMAVMNVYRFGGDQQFLSTHWPRVEKAVAYIERLRGERMTARYSDPQTTATRQEPGKPAVSLHAFYGLMPESISHEGYSAKPMHSYWDDFFTLKGLKDAAEMARVLGKEADRKRYQALADDFAKTLYASIKLAITTHGIDYIPGCVELGDFDATSTTIALWPCGELSRLPRPALDHTFERYWGQFIARRDDPTFAWTAYTPYELRCVGTMVLLDQVDRAHEALDFFMHDRSPPGWRQWPEVVHREPRAALFIGDMPHTWCGSDFLNSVRIMFLYERETDDALVLLAGVPKSWVSSRPVGFNDMPTYGGRVSCTLQRENSRSGQLVAQIRGTCPIPAGGIRLTIPTGPATKALVNGKGAELDENGRVVVRQLPAKIEIQLAEDSVR